MTNAASKEQKKREDLERVYKNMITHLLDQSSLYELRMVASFWKRLHENIGGKEV